MKTRAGIVLLGLTALASSGIAAPANKGKVDIQNQFIVVHPGAKLSKDDAKALNEVLKKYDKSLYKIEVYKDGKTTKTLGSLSDMKIDQKVAAELADAKKNGESDRAVQVIAPPQTGATTNPQTGTPAPGVAVNPQTMSPTPGLTTNPQTGTPAPGVTVNPQTGTPIPGATTNPQFVGSTTNPQKVTDGASASTSFKPVSGGQAQATAATTNPQFNGSTTNPQKDTSTPPPTGVIQELAPILQKYSGEQK